MSGKIIITGASGFIGSALSVAAIENNYEVFALTRNPKKKSDVIDERVRMVGWDARTANGWLQQAEEADAIVNLAGENIGSGLWTNSKKRTILESRLHAGAAVNEAIRRARKKPRVLVQASAIGFYGSRGDEILDEFSTAGDGFLAEVVRKWEESTAEVTPQGVRRVIMRNAIVLGKEGGMLSRLTLPFRLFLGGHPGTGKQWFSWIHIQDLVRAILFSIEIKNFSGIFNAAAPEPLPMKEFFKLLAKQLNRPSWLHIPSPLLKALMGDMAEDTLLTSQRVMPHRLLEAGFKFSYPSAESALRHIFGEK